VERTEIEWTFQIETCEEEKIEEQEKMISYVRRRKKRLPRK
jgi:hypothetical protein